MRAGDTDDSIADGEPGPSRAAAAATPTPTTASTSAGTAASPARPPARRVLRDEVWIVLALTFLASAVWSLFDLAARPSLEGTSAVLFQVEDGGLALARGVVRVAFALVPVLLVVHLLHRSGETASDIGLSVRPATRLRRDLGRGVALFALVGAVGLGWYALAVAAGVNRNVVVIDGDGPWWTVPLWLLNAMRYAVTEEVIVVGYLLHRLDQLGCRENRSLAASAVLRGSYHLYQGWGGFFGNLAMGLLFGRVYQRTKRTVPLVTAHFLVDAVAGLGYLALRNRVGWLTNS
jgi:membrane protease YdiL (CAAX protease family)